RLAALLPELGAARARHAPAGALGAASVTTPWELSYRLLAQASLQRRQARRCPRPGLALACGAWPCAPRAERPRPRHATAPPNLGDDDPGLRRRRCLSLRPPSRLPAFALGRRHGRWSAEAQAAAGSRSLRLRERRGPHALPRQR